MVHKLYVSGKRVDQVCKPSLRSLADDTTLPNADLALAFTAKELPPPLAPQDAVDLDGAAAVAAVAPQLVDAFSTALGLDLYGVDLVTETNSGQLYALDINFFPSYASAATLYDDILDLAGGLVDQ